MGDSQAIPQIVVIPPRTSTERKAWPLITRFKIPGGQAFDEIPTLRSTPWEITRKRSQRARQPPSLSMKTMPSHIFLQLPTQVFHCILTQLSLLHVKEMMVDATGLLRDLSACCLVNKRWLHATREHLYYNIWLLHNQMVPKSKRFSLTRRKTRLELLRRTLNEHQSIANLIHHLSITPSLRADLTVTKGFAARSHALDLLLQIIELCPNLESVDGFLPELSPHYASYYQALLRRPQLQSLVWWTRSDSWYLIDLSRLSQYKESWQCLTTLVLSQGNAAKSFSMIEDSVLALVKQMPSLQSLMLAGLAKSDVNDETMKALPSLVALRLEDLKGVTDQGLANLCESEYADQLKSLTLSGLQLKSMSIIAELLDSCSALERLRFVQLQAPEMLKSEDDTFDFLLESDSLRYLHWETLLAEDSTKLIAESISAGMFPALRTIKTPCDNDDTLQALCRPIQEMELTPDDLKFMDKGRLHESSTSIRLAQLRAQLRLQERRKEPSFSVVVSDEDQQLETNVIGAYLGHLDSEIEYCLEPDVEGSSAALSQLSDLLQPKEHGIENASISTLLFEPPSFPAYSYDVLF